MRHLVALCAAVTLLVGCTTAPVPSSSSAGAASMSKLASGLEDALRAKDLTAFSEGFDAEQADLAAAWYRFLSTGRGAVAAKSAAGQVLVVTTRFTGDRREASEQITVGLDAQGRIDAVQPTTGAPLWALQAGASVAQTSTDTLIADGLSAAELRTWQQRLRRADAAVTKARVLTQDAGWTGGLVVVLPDSGDDFATITGSAASDTAAVTSCASGTPRIVVNPAVNSRPAAWIQATLVHEAVHVATESACHSGVAWAVEGLAESVAEQSDAATATANRKLVIARLRGQGLPDALPTAPSTQTDYALAALAAQAVRDHLGAKAPALFARLTRDVDALNAAETRQLTGWYRQALRTTLASG